MPLSWVEFNNDGVKGGVGSGDTNAALAEISCSGVWYCRWRDCWLCYVVGDIDAFKYA